MTALGAMGCAGDSGPFARATRGGGGGAWRGRITVCWRHIRRLARTAPGAGGATGSAGPRALSVCYGMYKLLKSQVEARVMMTYGYGRNLWFCLC